MAADPTLADRLAIDHQHTMPTTQLRNCTCPVCPDLRAAAVRLRKLDAIEETIGDVDQLRAIARFGLARRSHTDGHAYLRRIADALDS